MSESQLVFHVIMQLQTSMQSILANILRIGLVQLSAGTYEAIASTAAAVLSPEMETGRVDRHRSGCRSGRDSSTGRSSRLKNRSNSPFWQLKDI